MKTVTIKIPEDDGVVYKEFSYPAGEKQVRFLPYGINEISNADKITVICRSQDIMTLVLLTDALRELARPYVTRDLVLPYLPYARADRRFINGDCLGIKAFGQIVNSLRYYNVRTLDAHSDIAEKYITNLHNVSPKPLITEVLRRIGRQTATLLPDKGATRYGWLPDDENVFQCEKVRNPETGELSSFKVPNLQAYGHDSALIIDDICDGGGTFVGIAKELNKNRPPNKNYDLYLYTTHGIYSKGFGELLTYFKHLFCSDSFPNKGSDKWLTQFPCSPLLYK